MSAYWRHLANTTELMLSSSHRSLQPKRQIDRFSRFCTAHGRKSLYFTMGDPFPKFAPSHGVSGPHLTHDSFGHYGPTIQTASRSVQPFSHMCPQCPYTLPWAPLSPKLPLSMGYLDPHLTPDFFGPSEPTTKRHLDWFSRCCTYDRIVSLYFTMGRPFPLNTVSFHGGSGRHLIHCSI